MVLLIITILAAMSLAALSGATQMAREQRTRAIISKLDQLVMEKYESYRTRPVPIRVPAGTTPQVAAQRRLYALRELMRMEMPDRRTDIVNYMVSPPKQEISGYSTFFGTPFAIASLNNGYMRAAVRATGGNPYNPTTWTCLTQWTNEYQGAECLYLIVSTMRDGDKSALDFFSPSEIGDVDEDGMKEILDGWGMPIEFLRWAPAYLKNDSSLALTLQTSEYTVNSADPAGIRTYLAPDPFDPVHADVRWTTPIASGLPAWGYALYPLIFSAGRDKKYDIAQNLFDPQGNDFRYITATTVINGTTIAVPNDPYYIPTALGQVPLGTQFDADADGYLSYSDNITNHYQQTP